MPAWRAIITAGIMAKSGQNRGTNTLSPAIIERLSMLEIGNQNNWSIQSEIPVIIAIHVPSIICPLHQISNARVMLLWLF